MKGFIFASGMIFWGSVVLGLIYSGLVELWEHILKRIDRRIAARVQKEVAWQIRRIDIKDRARLK